MRLVRCDDCGVELAFSINDVPEALIKWKLSAGSGPYVDDQTDDGVDLCPVCRDKVPTEWEYRHPSGRVASGRYERHGDRVYAIYDHEVPHTDVVVRLVESADKADKALNNLRPAINALFQPLPSEEEAQPAEGSSRP